MHRRRTPRVGADRWLVSYADFTTLLLAFFMALYTVSDVNEAKMASAASSLREAFDMPVSEPADAKAAGSRPAEPVEPSSVRGAGSSDPDAMASVRARIEQELAGAITAGQLEIGADDRGLVLSLPESATFPVASADVTSDAQAVIDRVATTLEPLDVAVRIEGHTDDTPIRTARYSSNWELSTARASAVVARFIAQRVDPRRLSAAGYGEFHPRASNGTADGRASNRRVDVVVNVSVVGRGLTPIAEADSPIGERGRTAIVRRLASD
jgi:chemotaxis protein MotB